MKATVSSRALLARINRKLAAEQQQMKKARYGTRLNQNVGDFYIVDMSRNAIDSMHCDLEGWGRELGALAAHERLEG